MPPQCLQLQYLQQPKHGSNLNVHWPVEKEKVEDVVEYYLAMQKDKMTPLIATWMELEITIPSETREIEMSYITYTWNLRKMIDKRT